MDDIALNELVTDAHPLHSCISGSSRTRHRRPRGPLFMGQEDDMAEIHQLIIKEMLSKANESAA
jgi:hypothetical protein